MSDYNVKKGNLLPVIAATLVNPDLTPFNLTGCTVAFNFQGPVGFTGAAVIVSPTAGTVTYTFATGQTDVPGDYQAEWLVTLADTSVRRFPETGYLTLTILEPLPIAPPANVTLIRDCYEPIRALLGDFDVEFRKYQDSDLASVVRSILRTGAVTGYAVTADNRGITPALTSPKLFGRVIFHSVKALLRPDIADFSFRTRALSQRLGNQREFFRDIENTLYDLENDGVFVTWTSFYTWVNSVAGVNVWQNLTELEINAPVAQVTVGRDGVKVTSA